MPFPTTQWSLILSAGDTGTEGERALAELCRVYWYPVYSFIRARSASADQAQDLCQEFFLHLLSRKVFAAAKPEAGRFRSFLASSLKFFLADQADRRNARKRGGGVAMLPIDLSRAEERYAQDAAHGETPERIFERGWALAVVSETYDQLRDAAHREGRSGMFQHLQAFLPGGSEPPDAGPLAKQLGMTEGALNVAIHRLRRRYRELLRANVSHTLSDPRDVEDEIRFLLTALSA